MAALTVVVAVARWGAAMAAMKAAQGARDPVAWTHEEVVTVAGRVSCSTPAK